MAMATSSPVNNNGSNAPAVAPLTPNGAITPAKSSFEMPKQSLRGIKKPKCIKCGNIARSRCPFQSCKSCCAKAQNPCHIHVLKLNGTLPDKPPTASSLPEQPSNDVPSSISGAAMRLSSLRQLSNTFINSLRTRRPLSRKDAENINKWRFMKLREHIEGNIEVENEAFDRYMQNVSLLEETFSINSLEDTVPVPEPEASSSHHDFSRLVTGLKLRLRSDPERAKKLREEAQGIVANGLYRLKEMEYHRGETYQADDSDSSDESKRRKKILKSRFKRTAAVDNLLDKLIKARTDDDLRFCAETKVQLYNPDGHSAPESSQQISNASRTKDSSDPITAAFSYSLPKPYTSVQIDDGSLSGVDEEFHSLDQICQL